MYLNLNSGALVGGVSFEQSVELASELGFGGVSPDIGYLAELSPGDLTVLAGQFADSGLRWGAGGIGVNPGTADDAEFASSLEQLRAHAAVMQRAGIDRTVRYLWPTSDDLTYEQNLELHAARIGKIGAALAEHGVRLGLEYVGPKTLWSTGKYPFVRTLSQTRDLITASGATNVGLCLDTFHWFTAGESADDLRQLTDSDVISVDLNDGVAGVAADDQIDGQRELPGATGVIDVAAFVGALKDIGYTGPVQAEPFNAVLKSLEPREAIQRTVDSLKASVGG
jgi:sugar phosphate isomerase/epimerase